MMTIEYQKVLDYDTSWNPIYRILGFGLHRDTKPTSGVGNGSAIVEMDTSKVYFYDAENQDWLEWGAEAQSASTLSASPSLSPSVQPISFDRPGLSTQVIELGDDGPVEEEFPEEEQEDTPDET